MAYPLLQAGGLMLKKFGQALGHKAKKEVASQAPPLWSIGSWAVFGMAFLGFILVLAVAGGTAGELGGVENPVGSDAAIPPPTGDCAGIAQKALDENAYNVIETPAGSNDGPRIAGYTDNNPEAWCADFVSWVLWQSGNRLNPNGIPSRVRYSSDATAGREASVANMVSYYRNNEIFLPRGSAAQPGDLVFYDWLPDVEVFSGHTGVVVNFDAGTGVMTTVEGNFSNRVRTRRVNVNNSAVTGFGRLKACQTTEGDQLVP